jgi:hypothetical protein
MADAIWPPSKELACRLLPLRNGDPQAIASAIEQNIGPLTAFRDRTIDTLCAADEPVIRTLFWAFAKATGRTNSKGFQASSVGAAKALHLLCPGILPLWDNAISDRLTGDVAISRFILIRQSGVLNLTRGLMPRSVKIAPEIDAKLYQELVSVAKENGQSQRFVLERALEHYLHNVVPSQRMVRPEVMAAYRRSNEKYRELYKKLAK